MQFFLQKGLLSTHQSAIREAPTVFSRLPSLMAADKLCPQLQPSLLLIELLGSRILLNLFFIEASFTTALPTGPNLSYYVPKNGSQRDLYKMTLLLPLRLRILMCFSTFYCTGTSGF